MTPEQMQQRSQEKVKQITDLMRVLHIRTEAVQRFDPQNGILRNEIFWIDDEKYPQAPVENKDELAQNEEKTQEEVSEAPEVAVAEPEAAEAK